MFNIVRNDPSARNERIHQWSVFYCRYGDVRLSRPARFAPSTSETYGTGSRCQPASFDARRNRALSLLVAACRQLGSDHKPVVLESRRRSITR